ncbi:MAG: hypothetical protein IKY52_07735 [Clostridia bacterium]|nr:hypothetical protein [Clostridia bacterium]
MKSVLSKAQAFFWAEGVPRTYTTNCSVWDDHLIRDNGYVYFDDIDYTQQDVAVWDALNHINRILDKLMSCGKEAALADKALLEDINGALDYWYDNDFKNPNWWYNQIGLVNALSAVTIMLIDVLTPQRLTRSAEIIQRGSVAGCPAILQWTGANLIWGIRDTIYHALIIGDRDLLLQASRRMADEIYIAEGGNEGIKPDMSFYQHGPILYSCGYGRSFTRETAQLIAILSGSDFAIPTEKVRLFEQFVLEGQRYMMRGRYVDYQTIGREIARPGAVSAAPFADALKVLGETAECSRFDELEAYYQALTTGNDTFAGTKYFPYSYFLSHNTPGFRISVKGYHTHYKGTEWGLRENRLGYNLNYGSVMTMMADGDEYFNINPVFDYAAVPGTTAPKWDETRLWEKSVGDWKSEAGSNNDCGGYTDGQRGVLYMRLEHDGISGYKAFFPFEDGMICLGCRLEGLEPLYTTVDQTFAKNGIFAKREIAGGESVINGGFRYMNLSAVPMTAEAKSVTGTWQKNSPVESDAPVTADIFMVQIDHSTVDSYAYAVLSRDADASLIASVVNTEAEQSVTFTDGKKIAVLRDEEGSRIVTTAE